MTSELPSRDPATARLRCLPKLFALSHLASMLALTRHLTRDVAAIPLLWIRPLAVYLLTFIVLFSDRRWLSARTLTLCGVAALLLYAAFTAWNSWPGAGDNSLPIYAQIGVYCGVFIGIIAFHVSNLYLNLVPVVRRLTQARQLATGLVEADQEDDFSDLLPFLH